MLSVIMVLCGVGSYSQLLALPEPLESSLGEVAGPARLVLSTLAMTSTIE
jgi:hypothetical protein